MTVIGAIPPAVPGRRDRRSVTAALGGGLSQLARSQRRPWAGAIAAATAAAAAAAGSSVAAGARSGEE